MAVPPLYSIQYQWWHRLRRLGWTGFVLGLGGLATPLFTASLQIAMLFVVFGIRQGLAISALKISLILAPVCAFLFAWTYWYMEKRYAATLEVRCPQCGYSIHATSAVRCPECGTPATAAD